MRKTVKKWFWVWEFEKEEAWLTQMAAQGWSLVSVSCGRYEFESCTPNEYTMRLEMLSEPVTTASSQEYLQFVEQTGAQYIGHVLKWVYFRKKTELGSFDLYSDMDSRIRHLKRILAMLTPLLLVNAANTFHQLTLIDHSADTLLLFTCLLSAAATGLLLYGIIRLNAMRSRMEKERLLHE